MANLPEDNLREPFIASGSEPADSGAAQSFDSADQPVSTEQPIDAPLPSGSDPGPPAPLSSYPPISTEDLPLFYAYTQPPVRRPMRVPHYGHVLIVSLLIVLAGGMLGVGLGIASLLGWKLPATSDTDLRFNLLSEGAIYLVAFALCLIVFPLLWNEGYFAGLQWRAAVVRSRFRFLAGTALACFGLAILDQVLLPGPANAPIEKMMSSPGAAWMMFGFGITLAPFFEEMFFRGFLLPAMCTAADWTEESLFARPGSKIGHEARLALSIPAMLLVCGLSVGVPSAIGYACYGLLTSTGHHRAAIFSIAILVGAGVYGCLWYMRPSTADREVRLDASDHPQWSLSA
ncbi:MAG: lysostaphin resistance A-like protein, partial [Terracidiphilus sp.]